MVVVPALFLAVGVGVLVGALFLGKFSIGFDDDTSDDRGWPVTRHGNPRVFWIGVLAMVVWVSVFGLIVAAHYGFPLPPIFKF